MLCGRNVCLKHHYEWCNNNYAIISREYAYTKSDKYLSGDLILMSGIPTLRKLVKSMTTTLAKWKAVGDSPSLPDVASSTEAFAGDVSQLTYTTDLNTPELQNAKSALQNAWTNRADRAKSIAFIKEAAEQLTALNDNIEQNGEYVSTSTRTSMKTLHGSMVGTSLYNTPMHNDAVRIQKLLSGFTAVKSMAYVEHTVLKDTIDLLQDFSYTYRYETPVAQRAEHAVKYLDGVRLAMFVSNERPDQATVMRNMRYAKSLIDEVVHYAEYKDFDDSNMPLDANQKNMSFIKSLVGAINEEVAAYLVEEPAELALRIKSGLQLLNQHTNEGYDPKANRLIERAIEYSDYVVRAGSIGSIKSFGTTAWKDERVSKPFNEVINTLEQLRQHFA